MTVRLGPGSVHESLELPDGGAVAVRFDRCAAGWQAAFEVAGPPAHPEAGRTHRLVAPTLAEARRAARDAVAFLLGHPLDGAGAAAAATETPEIAPRRSR